MNEIKRLPNSTLRGLFLTSEAPERTAKFYREVAGLELEQVGAGTTYSYWRIDKDGMQLAIHGAKEFSGYTFPANSNSNLSHLYFKIESQPDFLSHIANLRITPYTLDEVVITVEDPDGRKVLFGTA